MTTIDEAAGTLEVRVSGQVVGVYHNGRKIYELEPDGETWIPPGNLAFTRWSFYDLGHTAVLHAAAAIHQAAAQIADMDDLTHCLNCGDYLTSVQWLFDPCPAGEDGNHRSADGA